MNLYSYKIGGLTNQQSVYHLPGPGQWSILDLRQPELDSSLSYFQPVWIRGYAGVQNTLEITLSAWWNNSSTTPTKPAWTREREREIESQRERVRERESERESIRERYKKKEKESEKEGK